MRGAGLDLKQKILNRVALGSGQVWTPVDFLDLSARAAIDKGLQRLAADGALRRIDRGLYDQPRLNSLTNAVTPPKAQAVIDAIVRRDQARLLVDGMTAANDLGLTTAVPSNVTVLSDARLKPIQLGAQIITFKAAAPSRLYWAGRPAMRIVQALYWLQDVLPSDRATIVRQLRNLTVHTDQGGVMLMDLKNGLAAMPIWMQAVVRELLAPAGGNAFADISDREAPAVVASV